MPRKTRRSALLKGLTEELAKAAGSLELHQESAALLRAKIDRAERRLAPVRRMLAVVEGLAQEAAGVVAASTQALHSAFPDIDPAAIAPIRPSTRYGKPGGLVGAINAVVAASGERLISTSEIARAVEIQFGLTFADGEARKAWVHGNVSRHLKRAALAGWLEQVPSRSAGPDTAALWRMRQPGSGSFEATIAKVRAAGRSVAQYDNDD